MVHFSCPMQFSKLLEKAVDVFRKDPLPCVNYVDFEHLIDFVKGHYYANLTSSAELEGILHQVN